MKKMTIGLGCVFVIVTAAIATLCWFAPSFVQQIQQANIEKIQIQITPAHEIWRKHETLKSATPADWAEQERREAEEKAFSIEISEQERRLANEARTAERERRVQAFLSLLTGIPGICCGIIVILLCFVRWIAKGDRRERKKMVELAVKCTAWCLAAVNLTLIYISANHGAMVFSPLVFAIVYVCFFWQALKGRYEADRENSVKSCGGCTLVLIAIISFAAYSNNPPPVSPIIAISFLASCWISVYLASGKFTEWLLRRLGLNAYW